AEDGIRDTSVTGVQTCALPIWGAPAVRFFGALRRAKTPPGLRREKTIMARHRQPRTPPAHVTPPPPTRPRLAEEVPRLMVLEREVEDEFRPRLLEALQR